jgi:hypothetical protein
VLAGTVNVADAVPEEHGTVVGRPVRLGEEEKVQVVTDDTTADSFTDPPAEVRELGEAPKEVIPGPEEPATLTLTFGALTFFDPRASKENLYDSAFDLGSDGTETVFVARPAEQGTVAGRPPNAGDEEMTQLVAPDTATASITEPPARGNEAGTAAKEVTTGGERASTTTFSFALVDLVPIAVSVMVYFAAFAAVLAGLVTGTESDPLAQDSVLGSPVSAGDEDTVQLVAPDTEAERTNDPPVEGTVDGVAVNEPMEGFGTAAPTRVGAMIISPAVITTSATRPVKSRRHSRTPFATTPTAASPPPARPARSRELRAWRAG